MSEFDRDREVIEAATPGPWEHRGGAWRIYGPGPCTCGDCGDSETVCRVLCREIDDAAFIARARERWPAALEERAAWKQVARDNLRAFLNASRDRDAKAQQISDLAKTIDGLRAELETERKRITELEAEVHQRDEWLEKARVRHERLVKGGDPPDPIVWEGDLDDDCTARWRGLMLRAEAMSQDADGRGTDWWWAVVDNEGRRGCNELASSNHEGDHKPTGAEARAAAEGAARAHLGREEVDTGGEVCDGDGAMPSQTKTRA